MPKSPLDKHAVRTVTVDGNKVGMQGLDVIFAELKSEGKSPSEEIGAELLERAEQHNYVPATMKAHYRKALLAEYRRYLGEKVPEEGPSLSIKILGMGCHRCETLSSNVLAALAALDMSADLEHVRDPARIAEYGVFGTPALVVNGEVRSAGRTLTTEQVMTLLSDFRED
jgi:hypothetical protein